jgi:pantoate--beta-alanine ligase
MGRTPLVRATFGGSRLAKPALVNYPFPRPKPRYQVPPVEVRISTRHDENLISRHHATPIPTLDTVQRMRDFRNSLSKKPESDESDIDMQVGLVPTMGAFHNGHLELIRKAANQTDAVIVSIYVNPTQFGVTEDLSTYPRTFDADYAELVKLNASLESEGARGRVRAVFAPSTKVMYPVLPPTSEIDGDGSFVTINPIARLLEGKSRPVFFRGVATVCMKLFNIVGPHQVFFGQKDAQQVAIIRRMIDDFHLPVRLMVATTEREKDGLAMSSRNVYLGERRRQVGLVLSSALKTGNSNFAKGLYSRQDIQGAVMQHLERVLKQQKEMAPRQRALFTIDYVSLADRKSMEEVDSVDPNEGAVLSAAIIMHPLEDVQEYEVLGQGGDEKPVRLIDNFVLLDRKGSPA